MERAPGKGTTIEICLPRLAAAEAPVAAGPATAGEQAAEADLQVLAKPFTFTDLAVTVRRVLDGEPAGTP
jgi:hypothetical protein